MLQNGASSSCNSLPLRQLAKTLFRKFDVNVAAGSPDLDFATVFKAENRRFHGFLGKIGRIGTESILSHFVPVKDLPGISVELASLFGKAHLVAVPHQQLGPEIPLEFRHILADRRLSDMQQTSGCGEITTFHRSHKNSESLVFQQIMLQEK